MASRAKKGQPGKAIAERRNDLAQAKRDIRANVPVAEQWIDRARHAIRFAQSCAARLERHVASLDSPKWKAVPADERGGVAAFLLGPYVEELEYAKQRLDKAEARAGVLERRLRAIRLLDGAVGSLGTPREVHGRVIGKHSAESLGLERQRNENFRHTRGHADAVTASAAEWTRAIGAWPKGFDPLAKGKPGNRNKNNPSPWYLLATLLRAAGDAKADTNTVRDTVQAELKRRQSKG